MRLLLIIPFVFLHIAAAEAQVDSYQAQGHALNCQLGMLEECDRALSLPLSRRYRAIIQADRDRAKAKLESQIKALVQRCKSRDDLAACDRALNYNIAPAARAQLLQIRQEVATRIEQQKREKEGAAARLEQFKFDFEACKSGNLKSCDTAISYPAARPDDIRKLTTWKRAASEFESDLQACRTGALAACDRAISSSLASAEALRELDNWRSAAARTQASQPRSLDMGAQPPQTARESELVDRLFSPLGLGLAAMATVALVIGIAHKPEGFAAKLLIASASGLIVSLVMVALGVSTDVKMLTFAFGFVAVYLGLSFTG